MKTTKALSEEVRAELSRIGDGIRIARIRRRMTQRELAERGGTTFHTIRHVEHGAPGTSMGVYLDTLWVLGLFEDVRLLADPNRDREGLIREAAERNRVARSAGSMSRDF
ncbi:MAG: XRE family transcriptional regulator [Gemmatimonadetes bacterium]|nr:XRE family transcriptional regulator [Gemmatimonadota bacterium]